MLQLLFYNRKRTILRTDDCNWDGELTQYYRKQWWLEVLISKKHSTLGNTRSLQVASWSNDGTAQIYGCKWSFEIKICLNGNICQIHCKYFCQGKIIWQVEIIFFLFLRQQPTAASGSSFSFNWKITFNHYYSCNLIPARGIKFSVSW